MSYKDIPEEWRERTDPYGQGEAEALRETLLVLANEIRLLREELRRKPPR